MTYFFDSKIAELYGVDEAIMINNFSYWINHNKANDKHFYDGRYWTYNSIDAFTKLFPFWTARQIRRVLNSLKEKDVLVTGNYNSSKYDRTIWYAFSDSFLAVIDSDRKPQENAKRNNAFDQTGKSSFDQTGKCIIGTDNKHTDNITDDITYTADSGFYDFPENDKNLFNPIDIAVYDGKEEKNCAKKEERKGRKTSETKCLFADSRYFNYEDFESCFKDNEEFSQVDIYYYYSAVADWSASKGKKQNDWIATARNFMRKDKEQNKLHIKLQDSQESEMYNSLLEVMQRRRELDEKVRKYTY